MMSGRGLGHTGGTLDKLEAIPGFRVHLSAAEMRGVLKKTGCAIFGPMHNIAPADRMLYALRDVTATVESIPLITASILSKKIAAGIDALVMDVKCGHGAFMKTRTDARKLASSLAATGQGNGVRTEAVVTAMDVPLGRMVGNALEVREAIATLQGVGPSDLETLAVALVARMLILGGLASTLEKGEAKVRMALASGQALERFCRMIAEQGGDPRIVDEPARLPAAPELLLLRAQRSGYVAHVDAGSVGLATMLLGAGRDRVEDAIDPAVGVRILAKPGEAIKAGEPFIEVHFREERRLTEAVVLLYNAWRIDDARPAETPLILESIS
jgi:pyrimidine-nucleoside phosphorylase